MHDDGHFGAEIAAVYDDDIHAFDPSRVKATVDCLEALAGGQRALEFAIGTGRIALPLKARGIDVSGIELSRAMIEKLREKERGAPMEIEVGDMATTRVPGAFGLVYLVFNTINNLTTQAAQIACFANAAAHLEPGGRFVIEVQVPPLQRLPPGETLLAFDRSDGHWGIDEIDVVTQRFTSHHVMFEGGGPQRTSLPMRYVWPSELDLMAQMAGLHPEHRWADWDQTPFTATSDKHVSVWRKA